MVDPLYGFIKGNCPICDQANKNYMFLPEGNTVETYFFKCSNCGAIYTLENRIVSLVFLKNIISENEIENPLSLDQKCECPKCNSQSMFIYPDRIVDDINYRFIFYKILCKDCLATSYGCKIYRIVKEESINIVSFLNIRNIDHNNVDRNNLISWVRSKFKLIKCKS